MTYKKKYLNQFTSLDGKVNLVEIWQDGFFSSINYGRLYNYYAVTDERNIAPTGWHVPTKAEFETLVATLGGTSVAGGKLKETGTTHWDSPNGGADNTSGFGARGGSYRQGSGAFGDLGQSGTYQSVTLEAGVWNWFLDLNTENAQGNLSYGMLTSGHSLRCIKEDSTDPGTVTGNDGKVYATVKIGDQVWMAENSAETKYRTGELIAEVTDNTAWAALTTGAMCSYDNDIDNALTAVATEVESMSMPFSTELPEIDHKFQCVRGTGCEINFNSVTDGQFFSNLYSADKKEFLIKHYVDDVINWLGYLNTELIREPYDYSFNYPIQVTGNDGFALMDRYQFLDTDGTKYTGIKSKFDIIKIIFDRIGLPFNELRICLATTFEQFTNGAEVTILHESYVDCANFIDEDGVAITMREVLEGILKPYGAKIEQVEGNIYISDIDSLASNTLVYKCYLLTDWSYSQTLTIEDNVKSISNIGYIGIGSEKEQSGGKNKQVVSYSPYPNKLVFNDAIKELNEFTGIPENFSTKNGYNYKTLTGNSSLLETAPATFETSYLTNQNDADIYFRWARQTTPQKVCELKVSPTVIASAGEPKIGPRMGMYTGLAFLITGEVMPVTKNNPYDTGAAGKNVTSLTLFIKISVGDKYYSGLNRDYNWDEDNTRFAKMIAKKSDNSTFADTFIPIGYTSYPDKITVGGGVIVPIFNMTEVIGGTADLSGDFKFEIWSQYEHINGTATVENSTDIKEIWIKNLGIKLVDRTTLKEVGDNDAEYIGYLNPLFKDEAERIDLICGTDVTKADRGKIMYKDGTNYIKITQWTRDEQTFKIEELLLNSLSSNYRTGYYTLSNMKLKNSFNQLNILTDTYTGTRKFMVKSMRKNYYDNLIECNLIEVTPDELTIVE